jgi:hypothetical protein
VSDEAKAIFDPVLLQEQKDIVQREVLEKHHLEGEAREEELITALAATVLFYGFDSTYYLIFGSQLGALQQLNSAPMTRKSKHFGRGMISAQLSHRRFMNIILSNNGSTFYSSQD